MKLKKVGLIARTTILVALIETSAFGVLGWFYADQFSNAIVERTYTRLRLVAKMIATNELMISVLSQPGLMNDMLGAPYVNGMAIGGSGIVIVSSDNTYLGRPATSVPGFDPQWIADTAPDQQFVEGVNSLTFINHIHGPHSDAPVLYYSVIEISTADLNATRNRILLWGLLTSLVFVLPSSAGVVLVAQQLIARRVDLSLAVLKKVEDGNLETRIPISIDDELGQLQQGINAMTGKVSDLLRQTQRSADELKSQKDLLDSIIQNAPIRVFWKDRELRYVGCNNRFARDAGMQTSEAVIGKTDYDMGWSNQAELYRNDDILVMKSGVPKLDFEEPQTTPDGHTIWLNTSKVPLCDKDGQTVGVLGIYSDITDRKIAEEQIRNLAYFDPLTNIPNRQLLNDRLQQATDASARNGRFGALIMLDLDNFKDLNDTSGHDIGDMLLCEVAERLRESTRKADTVARLGGDEFVAIANDLSQDEDKAAEITLEIANKIKQALNAPYSLHHGDIDHYCTASIGVTLFQGNNAPIENLLKQADVALYAAKSAGRNTIRFFEPNMQVSIDHRTRLATNLRHAIEHGELKLFYQSQVDQNNTLTGAEALLRWFPRSGAPVSPGVFIPLAEETGLIVEIGNWVLEQACIQLERWAKNAETRELTLSINVSAHQFRRTEFVNEVREIIGRHEVAANRLIFELTESVLLDHMGEVIDRMYQLKELGIGFSLDDFGTGFSSLSYLKRLPLDQIKIDQSFVHDVPSDPNDAAIVRAIVAMTRTLELQVIAEGVETDEQKTFLINHGCERFQGHLFSKPLPIEEWPG